MRARRASGAACTADQCACVAGGELGIALSGGGARGLAQLGVLKVLERARIPNRVQHGDVRSACRIQRPPTNRSSRHAGHAATRRDAIYASSAIPGLFEPLQIGDHVLVDGGWAEPVPVNTCHHLGAIHVVAVDVADRHVHESARGAVSTALLADALARQLLEESQLKEADFVVRPDAVIRHFADFSDPAGLIAAGEQAAEATIRDIAAVLERHRSLFVRASTALMSPSTPV